MENTAAGDLDRATDNGEMVPVSDDSVDVDDGAPTLRDPDAPLPDTGRSSPTMAYDPDLADRIRQALSGRADSREVKMFGGLSFMINGKMAATANAHCQMMVRCDPDRVTELLKRQGAHWPEMRGKPIGRGWIVIDASALASEKTFRSWIQEALIYNEKVTSR